MGRRKGIPPEPCCVCGDDFKLEPMGTRNGWTSSGLRFVQVEAWVGINVKRWKFHPHCWTPENASRAGVLP